MRPALAECRGWSAFVSVPERLETFSRRRERQLNELALAWLAAQPAVSTVIAGATSPEQVQANARAGGWQLSTEEEQEVRAILEGEERAVTDG